MKKVLIVGGVAGGASTATRLRRLNENLEIVIFEKGEYISFANCGLPYHIGDVIKSREALILQTPEKIKNRFNIDVRINSEVISVDSANKKVEVKTKNGEIYSESFDYLVLSPGAKPLRPNIKGIESNKIFTLRNINDMDRIKLYIKENSIKKVSVIGGGYVGVETAENLLHLGLDVDLIEAAPHILGPFDSEISTILENKLIENRLNLLTNEKVIEFKENEKEIEISLENGKTVNSDMIILSIGVTPDTKFLTDSGINLGERGHILVNKSLETNIKDIYALGDSILVNNLVTSKEAFIPLAGPANRQGRLLADNINGGNKEYKGSLGTAILKVFELVGASTGLNERALKTTDINFEKIYLHPKSHAGYYPGATELTIKVLFDKDSKKILGAQAIGENGVDKFIDVIATTMNFDGTIEDLEELELAYAPPFLSAKSPANMAGFIGENLLDGLVEQIFVEDLKNFDEDKNLILDVRDEVEKVIGEFGHSVNIPLGQLRKRVNELPKDKEIWVYCAVGLRGYLAARYLMQSGYTVKNIAGGFKSHINSIKKQHVKPILEKKVSEKIDLNGDFLDLSGLSCPGPLVKIKEKIDEIPHGECLNVKVSDPGFYNDIQAWSKSTGHSINFLEKKDGCVYTSLQKGQNNKTISSEKENQFIETKDALTIVVFSGDLDKAIAAFIIANGALAMGKKVTMFFTFWGLSILKKKSITQGKSAIEKMFEFMLPKNSYSLPISKMNMGGIGAKMIRWVMKSKDIMSLEELMDQGIKNGAQIVACSMSMDVMGIKEEELIDNISFGGVGQYLGEADQANKNLFI